MKKLPKVVIIGKTNSGKSTLFNRIVGRRVSLAHETRGATRDVIEEKVTWNGIAFILVDTGGFSMDAKDEISLAVRDKVLSAVREAAVLVLLADVRTGPTEEDEKLVEMLNTTRDRIMLAVNKVENEEDRWSIHEFHRLGLDEPRAISALNGIGIGDLLDEIVARLPARMAKTSEEVITVAIVGKPNVGKSSLVNAILGEPRNIVSVIPGTTRDTVNVLVKRCGREFLLLDTAGVKRRARTEKGLAAIASSRSLSSARNADVVLVVVDASVPVSRQDVRIASEGHKARRGMAVLLNKWDRVEKDSKTESEVVRSVREAMAFLYYAPVLTVSALTGLRVGLILPMVERIARSRRIEIPTARLNRAIESFVAANPPRFYSGGSGKIYYATQTGIEPPTFTLFVNKAAYFPRSYIRYINNQLRKMFTFEGTAIKIALKSKERKS